MIEGLYAAGLGMLALQKLQDVIANNIANVTTPGYKRQQGVQRGFSEVLLRHAHEPFWLNRIQAPGGGVQLTETHTDPSEGTLEHTGDPLNVALQGPGYIVVNTPLGPRLTRDGRFTVDAQGHLTTTSGYFVEKEGGGPITVSSRNVFISEDGIVFDNGQNVGKIRLVEVPNPGLLRREGDNLLRDPGNLQQAVPAAKTSLLPGTLELSNVKIAREMIDMMLGARLYEANQRVIQASDDTAGQVINQLGNPV